MSDSKAAWQTCGRVLFWLVWPALWLYLRWSRRARVLVVCRGELLVVRLWLSDGRWLLPGGGRHKSETAARCAQRELEEETGIVVPIDKLKDLGRLQGATHGLRATSQLFIVTLSEKPLVRRQQLEITSIAWVKPAELSDKNANPDVLAALRRWSV